MKPSQTRTLLCLVTAWLFIPLGLSPSGYVLVRSSRALAGPDSAPTVDQLLEKYLQAIGGKDTVEKLKTRTFKGTVEVPSTGETGTIEIYMKAPNKRFAIINVPSNGIDERGFNGTAGWYLDPDSGPQDLSGGDLDSLKFEADFYRQSRLKELYPGMKTQGKEKVGNRDAFVVEAPHADGSAEKLYFDAESGVLLRDDVPADIPDEGKTVISNAFEDYRDVDGVKLPFTIRQTSPDFDYVIRFSEIKNDVPIDDAKFEKPKK